MIRILSITLTMVTACGSTVVVPSEGIDRSEPVPDASSPSGIGTGGGYAVDAGSDASNEIPPDAAIEATLPEDCTSHLIAESQCEIYDAGTALSAFVAQCPNQPGLACTRFHDVWCCP